MKHTTATKLNWDIILKINPKLFKKEMQLTFKVANACQELAQPAIGFQMELLRSAVGIYPFVRERTGKEVDEGEVELQCRFANSPWDHTFMLSIQTPRKNQFPFPTPQPILCWFSNLPLLRIDLGQLSFLPFGFLHNYISQLMGQRLVTGVAAVTKQVSVLVLYLRTEEITAMWVSGPRAHYELDLSQGSVYDQAPKPSNRE